MLGELIPVVLRVNGDDYEVGVKPVETLLDVLREKLGLTGTPMMCDEGECGSCTVLIDGKPVLSCMTLAVECEGKDILTIEGLADPATGELHPLQRTFVERSGMQCGICTPGMILTAKALIDGNPDPTEDDVREALAGNLCRCGNYPRIAECVLAAAELMKGG
ncbi:MAG: (2Fe-2S)-binding protein [Chloroflexi bacterium]|nr:(2Fe-2S)-binding protein [Chloroflexota bacterium]